MQVLLLPVGRGLAGPCFTYGMHARDEPLTFDLRLVGVAGGQAMAGSLQWCDCVDCFYQFSTVQEPALV